MKAVAVDFGSHDVSKETWGKKRLLDAGGNWHYVMLGWEYYEFMLADKCY
jgi:hypothetical protein